jgi:hypothetical protein
LRCRYRRAILRHAVAAASPRLPSAAAEAAPRRMPALARAEARRGRNGAAVQQRLAGWEASCRREPVRMRIPALVVGGGGTIGQATAAAAWQPARGIRCAELHGAGLDRKEGACHERIGHVLHRPARSHALARVRRRGPRDGPLAELVRRHLRLGPGTLGLVNIGGSRGSVRCGSPVALSARRGRACAAVRARPDVLYTRITRAFAFVCCACVLERPRV